MRQLLWADAFVFLYLLSRILDYTDNMLFVRLKIGVAIESRAVV